MREIANKHTDWLTAATALTTSTAPPAPTAPTVLILKTRPNMLATKILALCALSALCAVSTSTAASAVNFQPNAQTSDLTLSADRWQEVRLSDDIKPNTFTFEAVNGNSAENQSVLRIESNASMSMMAIPVEVDLTQTPVLCWRWRVNRVLDKADMSERFGDDYAARLYVSLAIPESEQSLGLRLQLGLARSIWGDQVPDAAINYVWDNRQPVGTAMPNAYTDRVTMIVAQSGAAKVGQWVQQAQNIAQDIEQQFTPAANVVQIALAADTDNTGETVTAEFADIRFVAKQADCL